MRGYRMNVPLKESADLPYDAISEMWWDSDEARLKGFGTTKARPPAPTPPRIAPAASTSWPRRRYSFDWCDRWRARARQEEGPRSFDGAGA